MGVETIRQSQAKGQLRSDVDPRFILFTITSLCQHWFQDKGHFQESFYTRGLDENPDEAYLAPCLKSYLRAFYRNRRNRRTAADIECLADNNY
jgi:TetR/AcrR family transcriptional regulator